MNAFKILISLLFVGYAAALKSAFHIQDILPNNKDYIHNNIASSRETTNDIPENDIADFTTGILKPSCKYEGLTGSCCLDVGLKGLNHEICIELAIKRKELKAVASLQFDKHVIIKKDVSVGTVCAPLPAPLSMFFGCLQVYYADVNVLEQYANVCFVVELRSITPLLQVSFDCFRLRNGKFEHHSEILPEEHGLISLGMRKGTPSIHLNKPKFIL